MSRINGEKARAAIAKRSRTARRAKDRARRAAIAQGVNKQAEPPVPKNAKD
jgi:hypothetical protein